MEISEIQRKFSDYLTTRPEVEAAYLFGSLARGGAGTLSDIDVAVFIDKEKMPRDLPYGYKVSLIADLMGVSGTDRIDLVILNDSPLPLRFQVVKDGLVLFCRNETKRVRFETGVVSLYFDRQYYFRRHAAQTFERIAREGIL